jgi:zinc protease
MNHLKKRFLHVYLFSLLLLGISTFAQGNGDDNNTSLKVDRILEHPNNITEVKYSNGLVLLVKESNHSPVVSIRVYVRIGSIYEGEQLGSGISHYFEHIISAGSTTKRTEAESRVLLQKIGNNTNAYTTRDHTAYYITTEAKHFNTAADLLGDYMANCLIDESEFNRERGVIIQEIRKNQDSPWRQINQLLAESMFPNHPVGQPVIGHLNLFKKITREQVFKLYNNYYCANNMVVSIVGAVNPRHAIKIIGAKFADVKRRATSLPVLPKVPNQLSMKWTEKNSSKISQTYLLMGHHTVPLDSPDLFALDVASDILGNGKSSRLYKALREKGHVSSVYSYSHTPNYNAGVFAIGAILNPAKTNQVLNIISEEVNKLRKEKISRDEIARAVKKRQTSYLYGLETAESQASDIATNYISTKNPNFTEIYLNGLKNVSPEDIIRVANKYLNAQNRTIALLKPQNDASRKELTSLEDTTENTKTGKPQIKKVTLNNGIRVLLYKQPGLGFATIQANALGGVILENDKNNGISKLMSKLLIKRTAKQDSRALHEGLALRGTQLWSGSGNNSWYIGLKCLTDNVSVELQTLNDMLFDPKFTKEHFDNEKLVQLSRIKAINDSWQEEANLFFRRTFFGNHPYRLTTLGTKDSVSSLTINDLNEFYKSTINPKNIVISVFGDFDQKAILPTMKSVFSKVISNDNLPKISNSQIPKINTKTYRQTNNKTQSVLMFGFNGPRIGHEDIPAVTVLDAVLSGYRYPSGRLHVALRGTADLVYLVHAWNWPGLNIGVFQIMSQTSPDNESKVKEIILHEINKIKSAGISKEELESAIESIVISKTISNESLQARSQQAAYDELYGLGYDFSQNDNNRIRSVTNEDVIRVANKYLTNYILTVTGPKVTNK